jgi:acyl carrier protein
MTIFGSRDSELGDRGLAGVGELGSAGTCPRNAGHNGRLPAMPESGQADGLHAMVQRIVGELAPAGADGLTADSRLIEDLGYHSLAVLELAFALEDEFELPPMDDTTAQRIVTVRDVGDEVALALDSTRSADAS